MSQLICRNLVLGYEGNVLVRDLSFEVNEGDYLCIIGENGAGKSTLMRTILGLQKPMSGEIRFGGDSAALGVGYLPQQTQIQRDFPASVREVVLSGCQARLGRRAFYSKEDKERAAAIMKRLEIDGLEKRCYRELSGGQQQRVLLARALCATEKLLLLDEPVSGLDPLVTAGMYELISGLNKSGTTIIMISHDIAAAVRYADHILHIGSDLFFGTTEEYLESEQGKIYLGSEQGKTPPEGGQGELSAESEQEELPGEGQGDGQCPGKEDGE